MPDGRKGAESLSGGAGIEASAQTCTRRRVAFQAQDSWLGRKAGREGRKEAGQRMAGEVNRWIMDLGFLVLLAVEP